LPKPKGIQGVARHAGHHPFHCWSVLDVHNGRPLSQPECRILQKGSKDTRLAINF